jgi:hypothetical protein
MQHLGGAAAAAAGRSTALPDAAWIDYEADGGKEAFATKRALFFRSIFRAVLASSLESVRSGDVEALCLFGDRLEAALKRRLASQPAPMYSFVQSIVLARQA